jgi:hypothetical protein
MSRFIIICLLSCCAVANRAFDSQKKQLLPVESGSHTHSFLTLGNGQNSNVDLIVAALKYDPAPLHFTIPDTHLLLLSRGPVIRKK